MANGEYGLTTEEIMWEQFHKLWTRDVGSSDYVKKDWQELETRILAALKQEAVNEKNTSAISGCCMAL